MLLPANAHADGKAWLRVASLIPAAAAHQVFVHESAHVIVGLVNRGTIAAYNPWPCQVDGRWHWGYYSVKNLPPYITDTSGISAAPYVVDMVAFASLDYAMSRARHPWARAALVASMLTTWVSFTSNYAAPRNTDWSVLRDRSPAYAIIGGLAIAAGALRLITRMLDITSAPAYRGRRRPHVRSHH